MNLEEMIVSLGLLRDQLIRDQVKTSDQLIPVASVQRDHPTMTNRKVGIVQALESMLHMAAEWADTAVENDAAMGRPGRSADGQQFFLADIRQMVNDVARELGVDDPWKGK